MFSRNGKAAIIIQPVEPGDGQSDPFQHAVQSIRDRAGGSGGGLQVKVTGAAGYSLDAIKVFGSINGSLLLVAALIVLILLIVIYRSPIFWIIPFFAVLLAEGAARGIGYLLAEAGVTINGQSGGILPVLVFGAGTDYALLLVSRYREELRRHEDKHEAMAIALRERRPGDPRLRPDGDRRAAHAQPRRGQRHRRARADRRDGRRAGDDLDAHDAPGRADDLRAQLVLAAHPAPRRGRRRPDARLLAADRRPRRGPPARGLDHRLDRAGDPRRQPAQPRHGAHQRQLVPRRGRLRPGPGDPRAQLPGRRVGADRRHRARPRARAGGGGRARRAQGPRRAR